MVIKESYKPLIWTVKFLAIFRCIPGYWDADTQCFGAFASNDKRKSARRKALVSKIIIFLIISSNLGFILQFSTCIFLEKDILPQEIIVNMFFIGIFVLSIFVHIAFCLNFQTRIKNHLNSLIILNGKYGQQILIVCSLI